MHPGTAGGVPQIKGKNKIHFIFPPFAYLAD